MKPIITSVWIVCLLVHSAAALAQSPEGEEAAAAAGDPAAPCVAVGENQQQEGQAQDSTADAVPCEDLDPAAAAEDNFADLEPQTTGDDVTAKEEFETGEEISEDFPVPLPSDI